MRLASVNWSSELKWELISTHIYNCQRSINLNHNVYFKLILMTCCSYLSAMRGYMSTACTFQGKCFLAYVLWPDYKAFLKRPVIKLI